MYSASYIIHRAISIHKTKGKSTISAILLLSVSRRLPLRSSPVWFARMSTNDGVGGIAEVAGSASTADELRSCKIGGCCGKDTPMLSTEAVQSRMPALPDWDLSSDGKVISKSFVAKNWAAAMTFFNQVSTLAEDEGHHPDLHLTGWRNVRVDLSTHSIGGLSLPDLVLAAKIDGMEVDYSPKWLLERQKAADAAPAGGE